MENLIIVQLEAIAKERGIRGYYKLRKAELISYLEATKLVEQKSNIFDESIPSDSFPVLQPTPWRPSNIMTKVKQNIKKILYYGYAKDERFWRLVVELHSTKTKSG